MNDFSVFPREFYMARHGETDMNARMIISDDHTTLTKQGERQAAALGELLQRRFKNAEECYIISSALPRAQHTARIATQTEYVESDEGFNERHNGRLGGNAKVTTMQRIRENWHKKNRDDFPSYKGVQKREEHAAQVLAALKHHLQKCPEQKNPVFIAHHGTLQRITETLGFNRVDFENAALYHFIPTSDGKSWNVNKVALENGAIIETPITSEHVLPHHPRNGGIQI